MPFFLCPWPMHSGILSILLFSETIFSLKKLGGLKNVRTGVKENFEEKMFFLKQKNNSILLRKDFVSDVRNKKEPKQWQMKR